MSKFNNTKQKKDKQLASILKELRAAGLEIATSNNKPSEDPYYSSVSSTLKRELVVE